MSTSLLYTSVGFKLLSIWYSVDSRLQQQHVGMKRPDMAREGRRRVRHRVPALTCGTLHLVTLRRVTQHPAGTLLHTTGWTPAGATDGTRLQKLKEVLYLATFAVINLLAVRVCEWLVFLILFRLCSKFNDKTTFDPLSLWHFKVFKFVNQHCFVNLFLRSGEQWKIRCKSSCPFWTLPVLVKILSWLWL